MVRPTAAQNDDDKHGSPPDFNEPDSISPEHRVTDLEAMFGNRDEDTQDSDGDLGGDGETTNAPSRQEPDYSDDDDYRFNDGRDEGNLAAEALRRARRTEEAISDVFTTVNELKGMMQNGGSAAAQTPAGDNFRFSNEDRELINEAMKNDPASAMEILHGNLLKQAKQLAGDTAAANVAREAARQTAERDVASMFPAMRRKNSKFRKVVEQRTNEMRREYKSRGIDPDTMPELVKYAAMDVASTEPQLLGNANTDVNEDSRQRAADRVTKMSTSRGKKKADDLPELSDTDIQRGRRMGLDMSKPEVRRSLQMRRRFYQEHRR